MRPISSCACDSAVTDTLALPLMSIQLLHHRNQLRSKLPGQSLSLMLPHLLNGFSCCNSVSSAQNTASIRPLQCHRRRSVPLQPQRMDSPSCLMTPHAALQTATGTVLRHRCHDLLRGALCCPSTSLPLNGSRCPILHHVCNRTLGTSLGRPTTCFSLNATRGAVLYHVSDCLLRVPLSPLSTQLSLDGARSTYAHQMKSVKSTATPPSVAALNSQRRC